MRIADLSSRQIKSKVGETDISAIRIGQWAKFTVDAYPDKNFNATVSMISQTDVNDSWNSDSTSNNLSGNSTSSVIYYYVILDVDDPDSLLLPAMTARLEIDTLERKNILVVDSSAVQTDLIGSCVTVVNSDKTLEKNM